MADDEEKDLDEIIHGWGDKKHKTVKSSLKHHDAETSKEKMLDLYNNKSVPAHNALYNTFVAEIEKIGGDRTSVHGKKDELRRAAIEGLKSFFEKANKNVLDGIEDLDGDEAIYQHLMTEYRTHTGVEGTHTPRFGRGKEYIDIDAIVSGAPKDKKQTISHVKKMMDELCNSNKEGMEVYIKSKAHEHFIKRYRPQVVGKHVLDELKKRKIVVEDSNKYMLLDYDRLLPLHEGASKNDFSSVGRLEDYGLKYKKDKEE